MLDKDFIAKKIIDDYISLTWTSRYAKPGDFSMELAAPLLRKYEIRPGNFLYRKDTKEYMIIEYIRLKTDAEDSDTVLIKGRSFEAMLDRRVCQGNIIYEGTQVDKAIETILKTNIIYPENKNRKAPLEIAAFPESAEKNTFDATVRGETVGEIIQKICDVHGYGYSLICRDNDPPIFRLYEGKDRSYSQDKEPWMTFSPKFNNLLRTDFVYDDSEYANGFVICGEAESQTINPSTGRVYYWPQIWLSTEEEKAEGWNRKERFIDGSDISRWQGDWMFDQIGVPRPAEAQTHGWKKLPEDIYKRLLLMKTEEERSELGDSLEFSAEGDVNVQWRLNEDLFLGDIVQVISDYGISARCRITELIYTEDVNGIRFYPTFKFVEPEEGYGIEWLPPIGIDSRSQCVICADAKEVS